MNLEVLRRWLRCGRRGLKSGSGNGRDIVSSLKARTEDRFDPIDQRFSLPRFRALLIEQPAYGVQQFGFRRADLRCTVLSSA